MTDRHGITMAGGSAPGQPDTNHDDADVNIAAIFTFCAGLVVSAILIQGMIWLLFQFFSSRESLRLTPEYPLAAQQDSRLPPEPRLQTNPRADLRELRTHETSVLSTYGWVDKGAGVVRIPIDEALRITVQRGLPARSAAGDTAK